MLVITRRVSESIYINGTEICFTVLDIGGKRVKLGIEAPKHIIVNRAEKVIQKQQITPPTGPPLLEAA